MPQPTTIRILLRELASPNWATVRDGIDRASDWLRLGPSAEIEVAQLGNRLAELARHPKWEVRRAVAHAVRFLPHRSYHDAIAPLLEDSNHSVRVAAERTAKRFAEAAHSDVLSEQHGDLLLRWLKEIEEKHGRRTREASMRLAERYAELLISEAQHEIKKVTTSLDLSLSSLTEMLDRPRLDRAVFGRKLRRSHERVLFLNSVVNSLRDFTTQVKPEFRSEALLPLVDDAVSLVRDKLDRAASSFAVEVGVDPGLRLEMDRFRLLQAFSNLIQNAIESYEGVSGQRRLVVAARVDPTRRVVITFADRGCGMDEELSRDAFQLYVSFKKSHGTGFGLPLATKIIKSEHGGSISLASAPGKGTTVTVVLPLEHEGARA